MQEEFKEAVGQMNDLRTGQLAAHDVMLDVLIGTLLSAFPQLAEQLHTGLTAVSEDKRATLAEESDLANRIFDSRIAAALELIAIFR